MPLKNISVTAIVLLLIFTLGNSCTKIDPIQAETDPDGQPDRFLKRSSLRTANFGVLTDDVPKFESADIIQLHNGTLLAIFSNEYYNGDHAHVYKSISNDGGVTWTEPEVINLGTIPNRLLLNMNVFQVDNRIFLILQNIKPEDWHSKEGDIPMISHSDDNGLTWSTPTFMLGVQKEMIVINARNCTRTNSGRLIVPVSYGAHVSPQLANILYSDDNGLTWTERSNPLGMIDARFAEPTIAQLNDGRLIMLIRTALGWIYKSYSSNDGITWTTPVATPLQSPWTAHTLRISPEGYILAVHTNSPVNDPNDPLWPRGNLTFAVSYDYGETWTDQTVIIENTDLGGYIVMEPSITFINDKVLVSFLHAGLDSLHTDNAIKTAIFDKSEVFTSIHDYVQEDWNTLGSWVLGGGGTIETVNGNALHLGDNTGGITEAYKIQQLTTRYTLEFKAKVDNFVSTGYINTYSTLGTAFSDGSYRFMLKLENDGIYVMDNTGTWIQYVNASYLSTKNDWHVWKAVVNNGMASIYMDGQLVISGYQLESTNYNTGKIVHWTSSNAGMPTNSVVDYTYFTPDIIENFYEDWSSLTSWVPGGTGTYEIVDGNTLHLGDNTGGITNIYRTQGLTSRYTLQFRARVESFVPSGYIGSYSTLGSTFSDGAYRFMLKLENDGIYVLGPTSNWVQYATPSYLNSKHAWHVWKAEVNNGVAQIYMDDQPIIFNHSIESTNYNAGRLEHWTSAGTFMTTTSCYIDYTSYFAN